MLLALALLLSQTPQHRLFVQPNLPRTQLAAFEALPASGAGTTGAPCSTTAPTGARGEVLTATRASSATCQRTTGGSLARTGIAAGDMVLLSTNVVRQEKDSDGVLGLLIEQTRTNSAKRSEAIDNAGWADSNSGAAAPTLVGADAVVAPDGTATADSYSFPAATIAQWSLRYMAATGATAPVSCSGYVKGVGMSGTMDFVLSPVVTVTYAKAAVAFNPTTWSHVHLENIAVTASSTFYIGNAPALPTASGPVRDLNTVAPWGMDCELGADATSYIPTAAAAVTRAVDVASFPVTLSGTTFSAAVSYNTNSVLRTDATAFQIYVDANNSVTASVSAAGKLVCTFRIGGVDSAVTSAGSLTALAVNRTACQYGAAGRSACVGGVCTTTAGALTMFSGAATFYPGTRSATGNEANGIISRLCYDPAEARCI